MARDGAMARGGAMARWRGAPEVSMLLRVTMEPKPGTMEPWLRAPTAVSVE
jgi:hypothetical protein